MAKKAPGKAHRKGLSLLEIADMFRDNDGECILIDEEQNAWKPWQVRRKALEKALFA